jgi:hypothetical protein
MGNIRISLQNMAGGESVTFNEKINWNLTPISKEKINWNLTPISQNKAF